MIGRLPPPPKKKQLRRIAQWRLHGLSSESRPRAAFSKAIPGTNSDKDPCKSVERCGRPAALSPTSARAFESQIDRPGSNARRRGWSTSAPEVASLSIDHPLLSVIAATDGEEERGDTRDERRGGKRRWSTERGGPAEARRRKNTPTPFKLNPPGNVANLDEQRPSGGCRDLHSCCTVQACEESAPNSGECSRGSLEEQGLISSAKRCMCKRGFLV